MEDFELTRALMTGLFIAIGSLVFYLAFLISGRNPHRDHPSTLAIWTTILVGALLVTLSPIGYIIWSPSLFPVSPTDTAQPLIDLLGRLAPLPLETTYAVDGFNHITYLVIVYCLPPFVVGALGLGLTLGCWALLHGRENTLKFLREKSGLWFGIRNYTKVWERELLAVKAGGYVCVHTEEGKIIAGQRQTFSTGEESDALALANPHLTTRELTCERIDKFIAQNPPQKNILILGEHSTIERIHIPSYSYRLHHEALDHPAQGFFMSLSAIGLLLLALSTFSTASFLNAYDFAFLVGACRGLAIAFLALTVLLSIMAIRTSKKDNYDYAAALTFTPAPFILAFSNFFLASLVGIWMYNRILGRPDWSNLQIGLVAALPIIIIGLGIFAYYSRKGLVDFLQEELVKRRLTYGQLRSLFTSLYLRCDFNLQSDQIYSEAKRALLPHYPEASQEQVEPQAEIIFSFGPGGSGGMVRIPPAFWLHKNEAPQAPIGNAALRRTSPLPSRKEAKDFFTRLERFNGEGRGPKSKKERANLVRFFHFYLEHHMNYLERFSQARSEEKTAIFQQGQRRFTPRSS